MMKFKIQNIVYILPHSGQKVKVSVARHNWYVYNGHAARNVVFLIRANGTRCPSTMPKIAFLFYKISVFTFLAHSY